MATYKEESGIDLNIEDKMIIWYNENKRDFPFRRTQEPYNIWISEIMSQQTQMARVVPYYLRFIEMFPTLEDLANAEEEQLLKAWEGLGYYSRVRNMQTAAKMIVEEYNGIFPDTYKELLKLKGVGTYTAAAIASISFGAHEAAIDGNVLRVFSRLTLMDDDILAQKTKNQVKQVMDKWIVKDAHQFNQAFIELGATICTPTQPNCLACPLAEDCLARKTQTIDKYPVKIKKVKQKTEMLDTFILVNSKQEIIMLKQTTQFLGGMYLLPQVSYEDDLQGSLEEVAALVGSDTIAEEQVQFVGEYRHVFSHKIWEMRVYICEIEATTENSARFLNPEEIPIANAHGNILSNLEILTLRSHEKGK